MPVNVKTEDDDDDDVAVIGSSSPPPMRSASASSAMDVDVTDDDDDDPIVREVDVYLAPALADQIYLLQYPLQQTPLNRPPIAARIKPRHGQIELDYPIPAATQQGSGYCGGAFPSMKNRIFQSQTIPVETHMCLGQLKIDESDASKSSLHLVPLQHISQMRPSFRHVENLDNEDAEKDKDNNEDTVDDADNTTKDEKKPLVFQRKESERAAMIRKSSYAYKKASHEAEEWQDLIVCNQQSPEYTDNIDKIVSPFAQHQEEAVLAPLHNKEATVVGDDQGVGDDVDAGNSALSYIRSLNYVKVSSSAQEDIAAAAASVTNGNAGDIKSITSRLTVLLGNGWPIPYSILRDQFATDMASTKAVAVSDAKLFQALSVCAVLVRGNFCLHSKFLALSKPLQRARTFLLLLFQKYKTVQKSRLAKLDYSLLEDAAPKSSTQQSQSTQPSNNNNVNVVTIDKLNGLLQQVAKQVGKGGGTTYTTVEPVRGWELRVEDDLAFVAAHPQQASQHLQYWDRLTQSSPRIQQLLEQYNQAAAL